MKVDEITAFIEKLDESAKVNRKEAFDFFEKNWHQLEPFSKKVVTYLLTTPYIAAIFSENNSLEDKIYYAGILSLAEEITKAESEFENEPMQKLALHRDVKIKQIVKIFYKLKTKNHILSTNNQIAEALAAMFDISADTAYSYLTDVSRLENTADLI